jgi:Transposase IS66 family
LIPAGVLVVALLAVPHFDDGEHPAHRYIVSKRTNGHNGYTQLFATHRLSLFLFRQAQAASVPQQVFAKPWLLACLIVDHYGGYNKIPCAIQYCYSYLLRKVQGLEKEFPDTAEVQTFVSTGSPQRALAMELHTKPVSDPKFAQQEAALKAQLIATMEESA